RPQTPIAQYSFLAFHYGYMQIIARAAEIASAGGKNVTASSMKAALDSMCNFNPGTIAPVDFCKPRPIASPPPGTATTFYQEQVQNQKLHLLSPTTVDAAPLMQGFH